MFVLTAFHIRDSPVVLPHLLPLAFNKERSLAQLFRAKTSARYGYTS
jgi:hypothetical protein